MVVKATLNNYSLAEVPTTLSRDGRSRPPHLRSWRDGWRHLRFLLVFSPKWLFFYPGAIMMSIGVAGFLFLGKHSQTIFGVGFDIHSLVYMAALVVTGVQLLSFSILARALGKYLNLLPNNKPPRLMPGLISIDRALIVGVLV